METSAKKDQPTAADEDDDFCLADTLVGMSDEEIERMAERDAESEVSSCALSGIPLDQTALEGGLTALYLRVRAERAAKQQAPGSSPMTSPAPDTPDANAVRPGKLPYHCDVPMLIEEIEDGYRHVWGNYLALARHFEQHGPEEEAARYNEKYKALFQVESDLWKFSPEQWWTLKTEVLPPLIAEVRALTKKHLGY